MSDPKPVSDAVGNFFARFAADDIDENPRSVLLKLIPGSDGWTDEQWDAHDRKIAEDRAREAATEERKYRLRRAAESGFPARAVEAAQVANEKAQAIAKVAAWKSDEESILVLSGPPGCGKTVAATWWALRSPQGTAFLRSSAFAASSRYDADARSSWRDASQLVLDDLGTEYADAKGNFLVDLDELVDTYYGSKRPLLITTNCTLEAFRARYGARIVDRLRECGTWFSVSGESLRRKP